jgi:hypothetical protein
VGSVLGFCDEGAALGCSKAGAAIAGR